MSTMSTTWMDHAPTRDEVEAHEKAHGFNWWPDTDALPGALWMWRQNKSDIPTVGVLRIDEDGEYRMLSEDLGSEWSAPTDQGQWLPLTADGLPVPTDVAKPAADGRCIYRFHHWFGDMGDLSGVFLARPEDVAAAMGRIAYFGEVLGEHSDAWCYLNPENVTLVSDSPEAVRVVAAIGLVSGYNPLHCLDAEREGYQRKARESGR